MAAMEAYDADLSARHCGQNTPNPAQSAESPQGCNILGDLVVTAEVPIATPTPDAMNPKYLVAAILAVFSILVFRGTFHGPIAHHDSAHEKIVRTSAPMIVMIESEVMIDERFDVNRGERLLVDIEHSDLIVETGSDREAHVRVVLEGRDMERARRFYNTLNYEVENTEDGIRISADRDRRNWNWRSRDRIKITAFVTLPAEFDYDVSVSHGDVSLPNSQGSAVISMSHGDLNAESLRGELVRVKLSHGDLEAGMLAGDEVNLKASHGDIDVQSIDARNIEAGLSHGDVRIESVSGAISVKNSHGDIMVQLDKSDDSRFSNSHGDIDIVAARGLRADLDFTGGGVKIASTLDFEGTVKDKRANGRINGGGAAMVARTSHGSITLRQR